MTGLLEVLISNVTSDFVFEFTNLLEKLTDNLLLLILLGTFLQETEIIMLCVVQVGLLVEWIELSSVASLEDELLSLLDVL